MTELGNVCKLEVRKFDFSTLPEHLSEVSQFGWKVIIMAVKRSSKMSRSRCVACSQGKRCLGAICPRGAVHLLRHIGLLPRKQLYGLC